MAIGGGGGQFGSFPNPLFMAWWGRMALEHYDGDLRLIPMLSALCLQKP